MQSFDFAVSTGLFFAPRLSLRRRLHRRIGVGRRAYGGPLDLAWWAQLTDVSDETQTETQLVRVGSVATEVTRVLNRD